MSIHKSLTTKSSLVRSRNVLTRYERILQLRKANKWSEEANSPFGLPKVRVLKVKKRVKEKKAKEEGAVPGAAPAAPGTPAAQPAAQPAAAGAKKAGGEKATEKK